jgi:hypothetical protein
MEIKYSERSQEDISRESAPSVVFSPRAVIGGLLLFAGLLSVAFIWKLTSDSEGKEPLKEFEFTVDEPEPDEFELEDPMRDILREQPEEIVEEIEVEEKPDIHMTVVPEEVEVTEEVVETRNIEIETLDIQIDASEIDVDAPEEIVEVSEATTFAVNPIAVTAMTASDIFHYEKPTPPDKPQFSFISRAPAPTRNLSALPKQFGDQDAPSMGEIGPYNVNIFGTGDFMRSMTRFGGVHARSAVDAALHWLAVHQETDGSWAPENYEGSADNDTGVSGLALLAFMGGGHNPRQGQYRRNVLRGLAALLSRQQEDGALHRNLYNHAIATIALCEAYGRARDERVGAAARRAVDWLQKAQSPQGGWRYTYQSEVSDMSVSSWAVQALKTARLARIDVDSTVYSRAMVWADSLTDKGGGKGSSGGMGYTFEPDQAYGSRRPALTAAGMLMRQFSGVGVRSPLLRNAAKIIRANEPAWSSKNFYHWYYSTYAMHNMGGEDRIWWNRRIRDVLLKHQSRDGDNAGSWDPEGDHHGSRGGRVYTTALGALSLEVYYRYSEALNSFGVAPDLDDLFLQ